MSSEPAPRRARRRADPRRPPRADDPRRAGHRAAALRQRRRPPARRRRAELGVPPRSTRAPTGSTTRPGARSGPTSCPRCAPRAASGSSTSRSTGTRPAGLRTRARLGLDDRARRRSQVTVVTFEDVTALEGARRRSSLLADELRVMLDNVADAITVQSPDHKLIYANEAAARHYGIPRGQALDGLRRLDLPASASRPPTSSGARWTSRGCPGRLALAGLDPEPVVVRSRDAATGEVQLGADQGHRRPRPRRRRAARDQRDRGHHRAQALRGGAALPRRGVAAALGLLAGLRAHARGGGRAGGAGARRPLLGPAGRRRARSRGARGRAHGRGVARADADDRADDGRARDRRRSTLSVDGRAFDAQDVLVAEDFGLRAGAAVENARLYRAASRDRAHAADLAAAAGAAGRPGRGAGRGVPSRRAGARGRRRLLRRLLDRRRASGTW